MGLDTVELVMAVEEEFGLEIPDAAVVAADKDGLVKSYEWEGNQGGCKKYAARLRR
jgi:acyl carrier protein